MGKFRLPTRIVFETGCLTQVGEAAAGLGAGGGRAALVLDAGLAATPWPERAAVALAEAGLACDRFSGIENNPRAATIEALAEEMRRVGTTVVVGLGGGSVLDAAKAAAMLATNGGRCEDYEGPERFSLRPLPFIAVPTTCGTGSEVTWVSVITVPQRAAKISVKGAGMFPAVALVDADLLATLPSHLVAWTGLDALTHALEAVTGKPANPASDALATAASARLFTSLRRAARDVAGDALARQEVMTASTLAGMAFGNSDVGAVHCLSETLGGLFDVHHGLANAVLLAPVLAAHGGAVEDALARLAPAVLGQDLAGRSPAARAARLLAEVQALVRDLGVPAFSTLGIPRESHPEIARRAVKNGSNASNPRRMAEAEYLEILAALEGGQAGQ